MFLNFLACKLESISCNDEMVREKTTRLARAQKERMYLISDMPATSSTSMSTYLVTGKSGTLYTVQIPMCESSMVAKCNCMDHIMRHTICKHMLFIVVRVLKLAAPTGKATPRTLRLPNVADVVRKRESTVPEAVREAVGQVVPGVLDGPLTEVEKREIGEGDECAICYEELVSEGVVHCRFGCGNAVHETCFERYREAVEKGGGEARCVMCRALWEKVQLDFGKRGLLMQGRLVELGGLLPGVFETRGGRRATNEDGDDGGEEVGREEEEEEWRPERRAKKKVRQKKVRQKKKSKVSERGIEKSSARGSMKNVSGGRKSARLNGNGMVTRSGRRLSRVVR